MAKIEDYLLGLKVGDRVWLGTAMTEKGSIRTVERITDSYILVEWYGSIRRYARSNGRNLYYMERITGFATPEECREWDAREERLEHEKILANEVRTARAKKRQELMALFPVRGNVYEDDLSLGKYDVELHGLTEDQIRRLAGAL